MYQAPLDLPGSSGGFYPIQITEMALRGAEQFYEMNVSATRVLLQTQASTATAFGLPDWSPLIEATTEQARQMMSAGTEQILSAAQRANEVVTELQRTTSQLFETQKTQNAEAAEALQRNMQELSSKTAENLANMGDAATAALKQATSAGKEELETVAHTPDMPLSPLSEAVQSALPSSMN